MKWLLIVLILVVLIVAILLPTKQKGKIKSFFKEARNDRNQNFNSFSDFDLSKTEQRFKELENQMKRISQENKEIRGILKQTQCDIDEIQGLMDRNSQEWYQSQRQIRAELNLLNDRLDKIDSSSQRHPSIKPNTVSQNKNVFFAKNFGDNLLKVVSQEEAQYELEQTTANESIFTYCGDFMTACSNRDAIFDGVCQLIGNIRSATKITTIEKGTATLENGKWKVIKKAIIKFE